MDLQKKAKAVRLLCPWLMTVARLRWRWWLLERVVPYLSHAIGSPGLVGSRADPTAPISRGFLIILICKLVAYIKQCLRCVVLGSILQIVAPLL